MPAVTLRDAEALVGLPYVEGTADCMHLAVLAQRRLWGRAVGWQQQRHPLGRGLQAAMIRRHIGALAAPLGEHDTPRSGDAVLWRMHADTPAERFHIGTLLVDGGERWVLHTTAALRASVLQRLADCAAAGLHFEGFYRWL